RSSDIGYPPYNRMTVKWPVLALAILLSAAQSQPDFERLFARAMELHQAGDLLGAVDAYKAALALSPDRADALSNLGAAYAKLGPSDDAGEEYDAAVKVDPDS